ncbi:MAG TPA: zinc ribbon domain-containing protein [Kouleothrix sp.]|nr:zinc ribbon domain-containing protein [Kouleothrix sp.]
MKCPTCGAENEAGNRFCEQCGSRLDAATGEASAPASPAVQPTAATATCPSCGATVLPGEAFCDECGASLNNVAPAAAATISDVPTVQAPIVNSAAPASGASVACPACGHQNLPGDRFCDNCGAALDQPAASPPPVAEAPAAPSAPPAAPPDVASPPPVAEAPAAPSAPPVPADAPTVEHPLVTGSAGSGDAQAAYEAEKQRLNDEIGRQQKIIEQFEQMQAMFGAATPAAVTQGLADARDAKARVEAELAALQPPPPPAPAVDPAEVARLNDEIGRQQKIIEQFEQMQAMFGAATPAAVTQGLADARDAKARVEAELAALTGGAASAPAAAATPPAAPATPPAEAPVSAASAAPAETPLPATVEVPPAPSAPPPPAPATPEAPPAAPASAPAAPRLVFDDGKQITLPTDKRDLIIGREDPISGIFPEVDLTPYGGETGGVSRQHARLTHANGQWTVTDLHSTNYTRVDGARVEPDVPVNVANGARLQFGRVAMTFQA